jgi:hypothetical protein
MNKRVCANPFPSLDVQTFPFAQLIKFGMNKRVRANPFPSLDAKKPFVNLQTHTGTLQRVPASCRQKLAVAAAAKTIQS